MRSLFLLCLNVAALAQTHPATPTFEVVSIKPADPERLSPGHSGNDPSRISYPSANLTFLMIRAFDVKNYQIDGIDLMNLQFFSIEAKLPEGATQDQVPAMLQAMLADRFGLKYHRESRMDSVLALVVDKNGAKLKPADEKSRSGIMFSPSSGHLEFRRQTIAQLARSLSVDLGKPVLDMTTLPGEFDVVMDVNPADLEGLRRGMPSNSPDSPPSSNPSIQEALRALGLKLESRKAPIEHIVIDSIRKTPTEN